MPLRSAKHLQPVASIIPKGTKGAAIQDYNLPGNTVIAPIKIDSGWGFGHWQSWADADNIATTTSNAGNAFTNLGIMQPSLYLNYVVKV